MTAEYRAWSAMKGRCLNPNYTGFKHYGGRGIEVCDRWRNSFSSFLEDMGPRPSAKYSLERKDVNGNYEPSNCKWATRVEQARNKRGNLYFTFGGARMCSTEWAELSGIGISTIRSRMRIGLPVEKIFDDTPIGPPKNPRRRKKSKAEVSESRRRAALARHASMTPEQRKEVARKAVEVRWEGTTPEERSAALQKARTRAARPSVRRKAEATKLANRVP